ncbi:hypothetical protein GCM10011391_05300 [Pullulanibacillus camelliae]|uniref:HAD family hydrolase n=1 Tax=Pullulanibacillus camelliae TaxID=1707096 RepID=A0A8J2YC25_9BACL|nr:HAD family hydrolase [Pullulanibacillus camelliae]GGE29704.1 hypothetical protein GCM10011391_05300 [Pullulanibacillus camelliae]
MTKQGSNTSVVVFDLDGTLYADTHHFDYYAERLKEKLPEEKQSSFQTDYKLARDNKHTLKVGCVYDESYDLILWQLDNTVKEAYEWNGTKLSEERLKSLYSHPITIDQVRFFNIGDLWWVPRAIAIHYGLTHPEAHQAFLETRKYMMGPAFRMQRIPGLKELLEEIQYKKKLVLLTNSPEPDSEAILEKLGLKDVFAKKIFSGKKPVQTPAHFEALKRAYGVDYQQILSVGDNWINEIRPARLLGCKTVFIDNYGLGDATSADCVVSDLTAAFSFIKS